MDNLGLDGELRVAVPAARERVRMIAGSLGKRRLTAGGSAPKRRPEEPGRARSWRPCAGRDLGSGGRPRVSVLLRMPWEASGRVFLNPTVSDAAHAGDEHGVVTRALLLSVGGPAVTPSRFRSTRRPERSSGGVRG